MGKNSFLSLIFFCSISPTSLTPKNLSLKFSRNVEGKILNMLMSSSFIANINLLLTLTNQGIITFYPFPLISFLMSKLIPHSIHHILSVFEERMVLTITFNYYSRHRPTCVIFLLHHFFCFSSFIWKFDFPSISLITKDSIKPN